MKTALPLFVVALCFLVIEALLVLRIWAQATAEPIDTNEMVRLFTVTDDLAEPFQALTGEPPLRTTGVIDFTVLVAIEGYFIAMLVLIFITFVLGRILGFFASRRPRKLPAFVQALEAPRSRRQAWQPLTASQRSGKRFYVSFNLRDERTAHTKAGLGPV